MPRHRSGFARRGAIQDDAIVSASAAIRRALAQVDVFIDLVVAVVVLVVAQTIVSNGLVLDAVVLADAVAIQVVPACGTTICTRTSSRIAGNHVPVAANARGISVEQFRVAIVVTGPARLRTAEVDVGAVVDLAVAVVV